MSISHGIMDTDILSAIMRRNPIVIPKARAYIREYGRFTFSIITDGLPIFLTKLINE